MNEKQKHTQSAMLQAKFDALLALPQEAAAKFFRSFFDDNSWEEAQGNISFQSAETTLPRAGRFRVMGDKQPPRLEAG